MSENYKGKHVAGSGRRSVLLAAALAVIGLGAFVLWSLHPWDRGQELPAQSQGDRSGGSGSSESADVSQVPPEVQIPRPDPYDFSQPAPEREEVDNSYFDDAAFIGDSRTNGFMLYSGVDTGENLSANGVSMFKLEERRSLTIDGEALTPLEALARKEYGKVYISLGINELGYNNDKGFYEAYCAAIDHIRRIQPKAVIYIQALIPVNIAQVEQSNGNKYQLSNDHLRVYNDLMRQVAEEKQVVYLDLYADFAGEDGELPAEYSRDGVHMVKEACQKWLAYLKTHTVSFEELYPDGPPAVPEEGPAEGAPEDGSGEGPASAEGDGDAMTEDGST